MATLKLEHLKKIYDGGVEAVEDFNIDIKDGEFIVIVGPSGCGKSTTLRMIAGLEDITYGHAFVDEKEITNLASKDRDMAMVFQNYALYAHMTIYQNMAFSLTLRKNPVPLLGPDGDPILKIDKKQIKEKEELAKSLEKRYNKLADKDNNDARDLKASYEKLYAEAVHLRETPVQAYVEKSVPKEEIHTKVMAAADILGLKEQLNKKPKQLSGGQRQRVALGRAIVRNPKVFLFDEPLSNLDAKLRVEMRRELKLLHQRLGTTMIYVTHDQIEALTLADRIIVMSMGKVQQIGTPMQIYSNPNNIFVASFVGNPPMNFLHGEITEDGYFVDGNVKFKLDHERAKLLKDRGYFGKKICLGIRPEHCLPNGSIEFDVDLVEHLGSATLLHCKNGNDILKLKLHGWIEKKSGDKVHLDFNQDLICFFDEETTNRVR